MEMKVITNPKKFCNEEYMSILDMYLGILAAAKLVKRTYEIGYDINLSQEEREILSEDEIKTLVYMDEVDSLDWSTISSYTSKIDEGVYFPNRGASELIPNVNTRIKEVFPLLIECYTNGSRIDYDRMFKDDINFIIRNLNYCLLCMFDLFYISKNQVSMAVKEYAYVKQINIKDMYEDMYELYQTNRPDLAIFEKYDEYTDCIVNKIGEDNFNELVQFSEVIELEDIKDIIDGKIIVDENYFILLENNYENKRSNNYDGN